MAKKTLVAAVILANPKTGQPETFLPGADVPAWAAKLITNPSAWGEESRKAPSRPAGSPATGVDGTSDGDPSGEEKPPVGDSKPDGSAETDAQGDGEDDTDKVPDPSEPTPDETWKVDQLREWADIHGVDLSGAALKADILDRITSHRAR